MKLKFKKYPKKPKKSASIHVKERYLSKCKEIDAENKKRISDYKKSHELDKQISGLDKVMKTKHTTYVVYSRKRARKIGKVKSRRRHAKKK